MKSIQANFENKTRKHPERGSYVNFADAVKGKGFKKPAVVKGFYKFVNRDDYEYTDRKFLIRHLVGLTSEDAAKWGCS